MRDNNNTLDNSFENFTNDHLKGLNVLIVDDNPIVVIVTARYLKKWGVTPIEAKSGRQALDILETTKIDIVLLDLQMPIMDGFQTFLKIRDTPKLANIPVLALTADNTEQTKTKIDQIGMNGVVYKPFEALELASQLAQCTLIRW